MIISASRRTDIPAYYSEWFMDSLKNGWVDVVNPFNKKQVSRVSLKKKDVDCFVFWTKNPSEFIPFLNQLDNMGYKYYFQFTLNPYDCKIEKNLPDKHELIETFKSLSENIGKDKVLWRYDPIILTPDFTINYHVEMFDYLSSQLTGFTNRVTISFVEPYKKVVKALKELNYTTPEIEVINRLSNDLSNICKNKGLEIYSCSQKYDLENNGIKKGACIDPIILQEIIELKKNPKRDNNQRKECGCIKSRDIGFYNSCKNGCIYCYANS